jgi:hypothetical protein
MIDIRNLKVNFLYNDQMFVDPAVPDFSAI